MVTRFESASLQQSVQEWKESQRKGDTLKQWALVLGVPAALLYALRPAGSTVPIEEETLFPTAEAMPLAESSILPPISSVLLIFILTLLILVAWRLFGVRLPTPTNVFAAARSPDRFTSHADYTTPSVVDIHPGELRNFSHCHFQQPPTALGSQYQPMHAHPQTLFQQNPSANSYPSANSNSYTPIPQTNSPGMFTKHWTSAEETYTEFPEVVELGMQLMDIVEQSIVRPLLEKVEQSDKMWESELPRVGLQLVTHDPTLRSNDPRNPNAVSIFDKFLPPPLSSHQMAAEAWSRRQHLETYFIHPSFPASCRCYVLQRLRDWNARGGIRYGYRCFEKDVASGITDGHIVENLLIKMLDSHTTFSKKYLHTPSLASSVTSLFGSWGRSGVFLSHVRSAPDPVEYEVLTPDGVKKLKPGDRNIFEAFALFFLLKGRDKDGCLQELPQSIQTLARTSITPSW